MTAPAAALIQRDDVGDLIGEESFTEQESRQLDALIRYASALIRTRVSALDVRITAGTLDGDLVRGAVVVAVARALDTLRAGLRVKSLEYPETTTTYESGMSSLVYFTDDELGPLKVGGASNGAFTITPYGAP